MHQAGTENDYFVRKYLEKLITFFKETNLLLRLVTKAIEKEHTFGNKSPLNCLKTIKSVKSSEYPSVFQDFLAKASNAGCKHFIPHLASSSRKGTGLGVKNARSSLNNN